MAGKSQGRVEENYKDVAKAGAPGRREPRLAENVSLPKRNYLIPTMNRTDRK